MSDTTTWLCPKHQECADSDPLPLASSDLAFFLPASFPLSYQCAQIHDAEGLGFTVFVEMIYSSAVYLAYDEIAADTVVKSCTPSAPCCSAVVCASISSTYRIESNIALSCDILMHVTRAIHSPVDALLGCFHGGEDIYIAPVSEFKLSDLSVLLSTRMVAPSSRIERYASRKING